MACVTVSALSYGQMVVVMKVNGAMIKRMVMENWSTLMETSTKDNGSTIRPKEWELTLTPTEPIMKVNGSTTSNTDTV
jgi:hypothetical protein